MPSKSVPQKRKRGRPSGATASAQNTQTGDEPPRKKRGRPSNASLAERAKESVALDLPVRNSQKSNQRRTETASQPDGPIRKHGQSFNASIIASQVSASSNRQSGEGQPRKTRRTREEGRGDAQNVGEREEEEEDDEDAYNPYRALAPVRRRVPKAVIDKKWEPLPSAAVDRIDQLLRDVERSVVMRLQDDRKRIQASTAIQIVSRRLQRKITKGLPFPPATRPQKENDFDLENIIDSARNLEHLLTPLQHSVELLKSQVAKEEAWLEAEQRGLETLEANAKAEGLRSKKDVKKLHYLLHTEDVTDEANRGVDRLRLTSPPPKLFDDIGADDEANALVTQLESHLESIQANLAPLRDLPKTINSTRAAVQEVLLKHMEPSRYETVVLGN